MTLYSDIANRGNQLLVRKAIPDIQAYGFPGTVRSLYLTHNIWTLYPESNYQGDPVFVRAGSLYDTRTLGWDQGVRSVKPGQDENAVEAPKSVLTIYSSTSFQGTRSTVYKAIKDIKLSKLKHFKTAGSFKILGGPWTFYRDPDFTGTGITFPPGEYSDLSLYQATEYIASFRPGQTGKLLNDRLKGPSVTCWPKVNYLGDARYIFDPTLKVVPFCRSIKISGKQKWVLAPEPKDGRTPVMLKAGEYSNVSDFGLPDGIMSLGPEDADSKGTPELPPPSIEVCLKRDFKGECLSQSTSGNLPHKYDRQVVSIKFILGTWTLYTGVDYTGEAYSLSTGDVIADLNLDANFGKKIRSIRSGNWSKRLPMKPVITLYRKVEFNGLIKSFNGDVRDLRKENADDIVSLEIVRGIWTIYSEPNFEGDMVHFPAGKYKDLSIIGWARRARSLRAYKEGPSVRELPVITVCDFDLCQKDMGTFSKAIPDLTEKGWDGRVVRVLIQGNWTLYSQKNYKGEAFSFTSKSDGNLTKYEWEYQPMSMRPGISGPDIATKERKNKSRLLWWSKENQASGSEREYFESNFTKLLATGSFRILRGPYTFCNQPKGGKPCWTFPEGAFGSFGVLAISGAVVRSGYPGKGGVPFLKWLKKATIIIFEQPDFEGENMTLRSEVENLEPIHWDKRIGSVKVVKGNWTLYTGYNFRGDGFTVFEGEYPDLSKYEFMDAVSSLRPGEEGPDLRSKPALPVITVYEHPSFVGRKYEFLKGHPDVSLLWTHRGVSSIVVKNGPWTLYTEPNYKGDAYTFRAGQYPDLKAIKIDKATASFKPGAYGQEVWDKVKEQIGHNR